MPQLFAVIRRRGPSWDPAIALEQQPGWPEHAAFMDALHRDGVCVAVGPLEGTYSFLLIARADDAESLRARLVQDPWERSDTLRNVQISAWTLRLGAL
jgi:uncharacterized protein YciI